MGTDSNNNKNEIESADKFNEELERLFNDPELFGNEGTQRDADGNSSASVGKRPSLASHHRSHHHTHSSGSHHRSSEYSSERYHRAPEATRGAEFYGEESSYANPTPESLAGPGSETVLADGPGSETASAAGPGVEAASTAGPRRRIPLAAHHRSHRSSSGDHHHSSGRSSSHRSGRSSGSVFRRSSSRRAYEEKSYEGNAELIGQGQTLDIDKEEIERLSREMRQSALNSAPTSSPDADLKQNSDPALQNSASPTSDKIPGNTYASGASEISEVTGIPEGKSEPQRRLASTIVAARTANPRETRKASSIESAGARQRRKRGKKPSAFRIITGILLLLVFLMVGGIGAIFVMRAHGQSSMTPDKEKVVIVMPPEDVPEEVEEVEDDGKTVTYKGEKYRWNDNITTILFLGTDRTVEQQESGMTIAGLNGQADSLILGVIDNTNKKISFININRDTYVPVAEYTSDGNYAGEKKMQICLSYAYGRDNAESCRYTADAVSKYLYGMPVNAYARISYDAIPMLNDSVGGVTVTVLEDLSSRDATLAEGATVTLVGSQALTYVRSRNPYILETNEKRMARQKQYLVAFMKRTLEATREDVTLPLGLYANATPYMTTNITPSQVTYLTSKVLEYGIADDAIRSIPGKSVEGEDGYIQYQPDQTALYEMVLDTFYNKVEKEK